jgi:4-amino-4-deoxy-L-arabinose transferase-like glycosyltransferase
MNNSRNDARTFGWVLAMLLVVAFAFQGTRGIWEPDEGRYSSAGINMHEHGDWLVPTVDGTHPHLTKPPMIYWALASSFAAIGDNEWAARLPSALAFVGTGLLVLGLGRRLCPPKPWLPAAVWALSLAPAIASNIISTDPLLAFFEAASMYAFVEAWSREGTDARRWYVLMWLGWGLAFMTKGPPGLLPLAGMAVYLGVHDRPRLRQMMRPAGLLVFAAVAFTWFGVVVAQEPDRLKYFLGYEVYDRVFTAAHHRNAHWYGGFEVYLPMLVFGTLPWSALALAASGGPRGAWAGLRVRLRERRRDWLLLAYWFFVPLAVFFLSRSRLQLYVLPLFVPLSLMIARPLATWPRLTGRVMLVTLTLATLLCVGLKGVLAHWTSSRDARDIAAQLSRILDPHEIDEIVFVGMRPFYGLNVYLDKRVEGIEIGQQRFEYSKFVAAEDVCRELQERERNVYAVKKIRAQEFVRAAARCGAEARRIGSFYGDDNVIEVYLVPKQG